jgi:hypothetical protein
MNGNTSHNYHGIATFKNKQRLTKNLKREFLSIILGKSGIRRIAEARIHEYLDLRPLQRLSIDTRTVSISDNVIGRPCGESRHDRL